MGKQCSKCACENKEVIINQHGGGEASATADASTHLQTNNIIFSVFLAIVAAFILYILFKQYRNCHLAMVQNQLREDAFRRIRMRLSGARRSQNERDGDQEAGPRDM